MQVPSCRPGLVRQKDVELPPNAKKWAGVDLTGGLVKVRRGIPFKKGRKWVEVVAADLDKMPKRDVPTFTAALGGVACSGAYPCVSAVSEYNRFKALMGRAFRKSKVKPPDSSFYQWVHGFVPLLLPGFEAPAMTVEEWLLSMPSNRRKILQRAADKYTESGWSDKYEWFKAFIKSELLPGFSKNGFELTRLTEMLDRLIQGPHDVTHVIAGPVLKPLIHKLKEIWSKDFPIFYGSCGPEALHGWLQDIVSERGNYFWCDYSMFDNTHSTASWEFLERLYRKGGQTTPDFWRVMAAWRAPKGKIGNFKYQARVMNASGRDDTALSNGVLNGFAAYLSACAAWLDVPLMTLTRAMVSKCMSDIKISVCGDDSLGRIPECTHERLLKFRADMAANIALFGFEAKLQVSSKLYDAVYLGNRPYPTQRGWFWGKTIGRSTYKMGWLRDTKGADVMAGVTGIADMHALCSSHVPVLSDLAHTIIRLRNGAKRTPVQLNPNKPWEWTFQGGVPYDMTTLRAVCDIYSTNRSEGTDLASVASCEVEVGELMELLHKIQEVDTLPFVLDSDLWRRIILVDDL